MDNHFSDEDEFGPGWAEYKKRVREELIPKIEGSSLFVSLVPSADKVDIKFAVELGLAIMYDKPLIACVAPGVKISEKLSRVVDRFVELDLNDPTGRERLTEVIKDMAADLGE